MKTNLSYKLILSLLTLYLFIFLVMPLNFRIIIFLFPISLFFYPIFTFYYLLLSYAFQSANLNFFHWR